MAEVTPPRPLSEDDERNHFDCGRDFLMRGSSATLGTIMRQAYRAQT